MQQAIRRQGTEVPPVRIHSNFARPIAEPNLFQGKRSHPAGNFLAVDNFSVLLDSVHDRTLRRAGGRGCWQQSGARSRGSGRYEIPARKISHPHDRSLISNDVRYCIHYNFGESSFGGVFAAALRETFSDGRE
jgi:hypothetical protein